MIEQKNINWKKYFMTVISFAYVATSLLFLFVWFKSSSEYISHYGFYTWKTVILALLALYFLIGIPYSIYFTGKKYYNIYR